MMQALREDLQFAIPIPDYKGRDYAYAVDRARFDAALWDAALRFPGVTGEQGFNVSDLLIDADGRVTGVTGTDAERVARRCTAPLVVGADGRYSLVARKMNAAEHDVHEEAPTTIYYAYWRGLAPHDDRGPLAISYAGSRPGVGYLVMDSADATAAVVVEGRCRRRCPRVLPESAGGSAAAGAPPRTGRTGHQRARHEAHRQPVPAGWRPGLGAGRRRLSPERPAGRSGDL
jgi:2-polyprenyl-6-methoxyphenol hydroxylase-like FAD-dependent oxidoreductase